MRASRVRGRDHSHPTRLGGPAAGINAGVVDTWLNSDVALAGGYFSDFTTSRTQGVAADGCAPGRQHGHSRQWPHAAMCARVYCTSRAAVDIFHIREIIPFMEPSVESGHTLDDRLASRLRSLRQERGWSLDALAERSGVSRATLSRIENSDVSPTASVLGQLCSAHGLTMSRLMSLVEEEFRPLVPRDEQAVWTDPSGQFNRRSVSPPAATLRAEVLECVLEAGASISYREPPRKGLEHHLVLLKGSLTMTVDGQRHKLKSGDCLRYQLSGASEFVTPPQSRAHYLLVIV